MAQINCPKEYNYWQILYLAGIQPDVEFEKYSYDEENEILIADVTQEELNNALSKYDHKAWLKELEQANNPKTKEEILEERINELELYILMQEGLI